MMIRNAGMQNLGFGKLVKVDDDKYVETSAENSILSVEKDDTGKTFVFVKPTGGRKDVITFPSNLSVDDVARMINEAEGTKLKVMA